MNWAARMASQGIDHNKFTDKAARIGSCAHFMVETHLFGDTPNLDNFSKNEIDLATKAYNGYLSWEQQFGKFEFVFSELQLSSELYDFGGTLDLGVKINDVLALIDLKTSKGVYADHKIQVASYRELFNEVFNCELDKRGIPKGPKDSAYRRAYKKYKEIFKKLHGQKIEDVWVLKIDKEKGTFKDTKLTKEELEGGWEVFRASHDVYHTCKELGWF